MSVLPIVAYITYSTQLHKTLPVVTYEKHTHIEISCRFWQRDLHPLEVVVEYDLIRWHFKRAKILWS